MKNIYLLSLLSVFLIGLNSCEDFLTRNPQDKITDNPQFWNNEENLRTFAVGLYDQYFVGYGSGWARSDWFSETNVADWNDDKAQGKATFFTKVTPATETYHWSFSNLRRINVLVNRVSAAEQLPEEAKNHWLGVGRFLRAMEYFKLVSKFGDVPWYDEALESTDIDGLYRERQPREVIMDKVLEDLQFATQNLRKSDGVKGLTINRDVALAFASRIMLFEGTWQKYNKKNNDIAIKYLTHAKNFAEELMSAGSYSISNDYKALTASISLANNPEVIMYREYEASVLTHSLMSFQNTEFQGSSPSKNLIDSYLTKNGLPIHQEGNLDYKGDKWFFDEMENRDPRLLYIIDGKGLRLEGVTTVYATSGYYANRFVNESLVDEPGGKSSTNITDAPIMKLNEVMLNYLEASAELSDLGAYTLNQKDLDNTINKIRAREGVNMPSLTLSGANLLANGVVINDPKRDADVPSIIWEIRRERRTELAFEGIRFNDIRRWGKLEYADMKLNPSVNQGAWVDKAKYVEWYNETFKPATLLTVDNLKNLLLDRDGNAGYIKPIQDESLLRTYSQKDYLYPIPTDQIQLYKSKGVTLTQNPGWN